MKKISLILLILFSSCLGLKDVDKKTQKEKISLLESSLKTEKAPSDKVAVYLPYPLSNPDRPKSQIKTYIGEKGASVNVEFDSIGNVRRIDSDCPEVDVVEQKNLELDYTLKTREVERKMNIELANTIGKWCAIIFGELFLSIGLFLFFRSKFSL